MERAELEPTSPRLRDYLTVAQAAAYLGVSPNTVRAWGEAGKIPSRRNPANGYRLFKIGDLEAFLIGLDRGAADRFSPGGRR